MAREQRGYGGDQLNITPKSKRCEIFGVESQRNCKSSWSGTTDDLWFERHIRKIVLPEAKQMQVINTSKLKRCYLETLLGPIQEYESTSLIKHLLLNLLTKVYHWSITDSNNMKGKDAWFKRETAPLFSLREPILNLIDLQWIWNWPLNNEYNDLGATSDHCSIEKCNWYCQQFKNNISIPHAKALDQEWWAGIKMFPENTKPLVGPRLETSQNLATWKGIWLNVRWAKSPVRKPIIYCRKAEYRLTVPLSTREEK